MNGWNQIGTSAMVQPVSPIVFLAPVALVTLVPGLLDFLRLRALLHSSRWTFPTRCLERNCPRSRQSSSPRPEPLASLRYPGGTSQVQ